MVKKTFNVTYTWSLNLFFDFAVILYDMNQWIEHNKYQVTCVSVVLWLLAKVYVIESFWNVGDFLWVGVIISLLFIGLYPTYPFLLLLNLCIHGLHFSHHLIVLIIIIVEHLLHFCHLINFNLHSSLLSFLWHAVKILKLLLKRSLSFGVIYVLLIGIQIVKVKVI